MNHETTEPMKVENFGCLFCKHATLKYSERRALLTGKSPVKGFNCRQTNHNNQFIDVEDLYDDCRDFKPSKFVNKPESITFIQKSNQGCLHCKFAFTDTTDRASIRLTNKVPEYIECLAIDLNSNSYFTEERPPYIDTQIFFHHCGRFALCEEEVYGD